MTWGSAVRKRDGGDRLEFGEGGDLDLGEMVLWNDEFLGDALLGQYDSAKGSDGSAAVAAINVQTGGVCRLASGAGAGGTIAANASSLGMELNWKANQGGLRLETRIKVDAITAVQIFIGFHDTKPSGTLEIPFSMASDVVTSNGTDSVGFLFDTGADVDHWHLLGVKANTDATPVTTALAPVAATFAVLRLDVSPAGKGDFWINDQHVGSVSNAVTITTALTPLLLVSALGAAQRNLDIDFLRVRGDRV